MLVWLSVGSEVQTVCIWSSWRHCIPKPHHLLPHLNPDWFYLSGTGLSRLPLKSLLDTIVSPTKTDEPIEMLLGVWTWVGPMNHASGGGLYPQEERAILGGTPCDLAFRQNSPNTCLPWCGRWKTPGSFSHRSRRAPACTWSSWWASSPTESVCAERASCRGPRTPEQCPVWPTLLGPRNHHQVATLYTQQAHPSLHSEQSHIKDVLHQGCKNNNQLIILKTIPSVFMD